MDCNNHKHMQARRKHFLSGTATGDGSVGSGDPEKKFSPSFFSCLGSLPRPYLAMGQGGQLPPRLGNWLESIIKYYLFIAASYWAIMDCPTELLQSRIRSSDIQLSEQRNLRMRKSMSSKKKTVRHGRTGRSGCYGPVINDCEVKPISEQGCDVVFGILTAVS